MQRLDQRKPEEINLDNYGSEELDGIAIIGMSGRFPGAKNVEQFWQNLVTGVDSISRFSEEELEFSVLTTEAKARGAKSVSARGILEDVDLFDAAFFGIYPREAELMDPQHRIFLECAWESLESAGYNPHTYPGMIGVFAGVSLNTYLLHNLCSDGKFSRKLAGNYQVGEYQAMLGNDKDFMPTRVSYKLNLRGPSMAIQSACSSSLVAVSQACSSLLSYQCDMVLSGGVSITFPQKRDYLYEEEGMASVDGTCRTFDADAKGTVFGHGCAVVLLKRLADALKDGDNILAVIKGTAINNDGAEKIGYAAPSVNAQAEVIAMAHAAADITPSSISYIEAHGTGTPLGDPIEIAALTKAFRDGGASNNGFCAIGTGKPNISHLDVAAGATGLIKTVMQLQHGQIPPLLHFKSPNPKIDFVNSPFFPVTELRDWKRGTDPRRAGISAFGVGGTNAHVVIEEAPERVPPSRPSSRQLFPLSAKTDTALVTMRRNLAARLMADSTLDLADVAYTLQLGRKSFDYRSVVVASNREELVAGLNADLKSSISGKAKAKEPRVVFLFPGQGAQYVDMGRELYENEAVFREEIDCCAEILKSHLGQDVRNVLYPTDEAARESAEIQINATSMTQPAIFAVEYAIAKLWLSWGIQPDVLIGHSIGEYVCAVLANSFTLEDALALLSVRAKLMASLPGGSMLGVRLGAQDIEPMLPKEVSIAAVNSLKLCTVSGPTPVLEAFRAELGVSNVACRMLATSHAFHSAMMDSILPEFAQRCEKTLCQAPNIRWISTCTGRDVTTEDTADANYWSRQLRQPVRFSEALDSLLDGPDKFVFVEVGPGRALNQFTLQHPSKIASNCIIASLGQPANGEGDAASMLAALGKVWAAGVTPDWQKLHADERRMRVPLPTYPFERKRFWVEPAKDVSDNQRIVLEEVGTDRIERANVCDCTDGSTATDIEATSGRTVVGVPSDNRVSASPKERIGQELRTIFLNLSGMAVEDDDKSFMDLGFDSLFLSQASQAIDSRFKVKITFRQLLGDLSTVALISSFLEAKLPSGMFADPDPMPTSVMETSAAMPFVLPVAPGLPGSNSSLAYDASDIQRLLTGHIQSLQILLDQNRRQQPAASPSASGSNTGSLRVVKKPESATPSKAPSRPEESKRFGPYKPIEKGEKGGLTAHQEGALNRLIERYVNRSSGSKKYTAEHRPHFADPRAVSGFRSQWKEMVYPIVSARSKGSKIWDIDGNEYVDITMGFGTYFFGHSPDWLIAAIEEQLKLGIEIGPQSPLAGKVAKMIAEFTGLDRVTFCNTGSEAVMAAMRLARTVTGRNRIVYFTGDYHGMFEEVLVRGAWPNGEYRAQPIAPGIPSSLVENILVLEYGTAESMEIIKRHGDEIAAVMVEPVQSRNPSLQPRAFLQELRKVTESIGAALIFDEVVTGFRCHQGGAQAYFGVKADMATYGKVVGGGMPIGILAGTPKYMDALDGGMWQYGDESFPEVGVTFFAGTFVRHPLAMAAAHAVLKFLKDSGPELQSRMTERVERVCRSINEHMEHSQVPIRMSSFSAFAAIDYANDLKFASLLWYYLREKGIHIWEGRPCYFTLAHTDEDLQRFVDAFNESVVEMQADGFLPKPDSTGLLTNPTPGASDCFPLAEGQREMWLGAQMSPDAAGPHHACNAFVLDGEFDLLAMRKAIAMVVDRHEGLRCTFNSDGTEVLVQNGFTLDVPFVDLSGLTDQQQEERVNEVMAMEGERLFNLSSGPLFAVQVLKLSDTRHQVVFTAQMIACDGWSHYVVFEELSEIYSAIRENRVAQLRNVVPMREYARWQTDYWATTQAKECEKYWLSQFKTVPIPLDLPTKGSRPLSRTVCAERRDLLLSAEFYEEIKRFGKSSKNSSFAVLLAAFQLWLHRLSGAKDLVVGVPFSAQSSLGFDTLVGQCANTLPIRSKMDPEESFQTLLARTWNSLLDAQENTHYTFGRLIQHLDIQHDPSRIPLVSVLFNIDPALAKVTFSGLKHRFFAGPRFYYQFDLGFNLVEEDGGLRVECDFSTKLFDGETIQLWLSCYESLLRTIVSNRGQSLAVLPMVVANERRELVGPTVKFDEATALHQIIEEQVLRTPNSIAVRDVGGDFSYRDIDSRANQLARKICDIPKPPMARVGIVSNRTSDMVVGILAVLKSGCILVPIDPEATRDYIARIIKDADLAMVLANDSFGDLVSGIGCPVVSMDQHLSELAQEGCLPPICKVHLDQIAYVMYISSLAGIPQGVEITHRALINFLRSMQKEPGLSESDVVLSLSSLTSDRFLLELLLPLTVGAKCVIVPQETSQDPRVLIAKMMEAGITLLQATPTTLRRLLCNGWKGNPSLKILVGGEPVARELVNRLNACCGELWHMYGRPEVTVWSATKRLRPDSVVTLGKPINNTTMHVVDEQLQPLPPGVPGELLIGGLGLSCGYRNLPALTAQKFIQNPFDSQVNRKLFRTGHHVRLLVSGDIEFVSRRDSQVVIRGRQLDLGDIESVLREHSDANDAAVVLRDDLMSEPALVAYIFVNADKLSLTDQKRITLELRQSIRNKMSAHMHPARFVYLTDVPMTHEGVLDRSLLPTPLESADELAYDYVAPSTQSQERLVAIWAKVLKIPRVGIDDNFFDLGGQSLLAVKLFRQIEIDLGRKLPLSTLFQAPTIKQLASFMDGNQESGKNGWSSLVKIQPQGLMKPLFLVHGAGGNVLLYSALARHMAPEFPLYGLQSQGLDGVSKPLNTIEEMASRYLEEIRVVQPEGPYYLGGYCLGGTVAYEMAQRLQQEGQAVGLVAMLDTYNFSRALKSSFISFLLQKLRFHFGNFIGLRPKHMIEYIKEKVRVARDGELANILTSRPGFEMDEGVARATSGAEASVQAINDNAAETYVPRPYSGKLMLYKPHINYKFYPDPKMGWGDLALGGLEIVEFPFNPHAMLVEPYIQQLANALITSMSSMAERDSANSINNVASFDSKRKNRELVAS